MNKQNQGKFCSIQCKNAYKTTKNSSSDSLKCLLCAYKSNDLTKHIHNVHNMTTAEYKQKFNIDKIVAGDVVKTRKKSQLRTYEDRGFSLQSWNKGLNKDNSEKIREIGKKISDSVNTSKVREKKISTSLAKYGTMFPNQSDMIKNKRTKTLLEKYGVDNYGKSEAYRQKFVKHKIKRLYKIKMLDLYDYTAGYNKYYNFQCEICGYKFQDRLNKQSVPFCTKCFNRFKNSKQEQEIADFILSCGVNITQNEKQFIKSMNTNAKFEIDIFIPEKRIGFEFNGTQWHSSQYKDKMYHKYKTDECEKQGIQLIHIFSDSWIYSKDIIKSRIKAILNIPVNKIFARKCTVKNVNSKDEREFLDHNHLQGYTPSSYCYGLYYDDVLVSLMSFGAIRYGKKENKKYELLRFANKIDTRVTGGASKLFKYFLYSINPEKVISYADRCWSNGNMYKKLGFHHIKTTQSNYYYVVNGVRKSRLNYQKHKLVQDGADSTLTEEDIMLSKGYFRIYDAGNLVFEYIK
ncbi:MAG: MucR family transcriptional regulator [Vampirovibrionia bacterium]